MLNKTSGSRPRIFLSVFPCLPSFFLVASVDVLRLCWFWPQFSLPNLRNSRPWRKCWCFLFKNSGIYVLLYTLVAHWCTKNLMFEKCVLCLDKFYSLLYELFLVVRCMYFILCVWLFSSSVSSLRIASNTPKKALLNFPENDSSRLLNY